MIWLVLFGVCLSLLLFIQAILSILVHVFRFEVKTSRSNLEDWENFYRVRKLKAIVGLDTLMLVVAGLSHYYLKMQWNQDRVLGSTVPQIIGALILLFIVVNFYPTVRGKILDRCWPVDREPSKLTLSSSELVGFVSVLPIFVILFLGMVKVLFT